MSIGFNDLDRDTIAQLFAQQEIHHKSGYWVYFAGGKKVYNSPGLHKIYDLDEDEKDAFTLLRKFYSQSDYEKLDRVITEKVNQRRSFSLKLSIISARGISKIVRVCGDSEHNKSGELLKIFGTIHDVSDEEERIQDLHFKKRVFDSIKDTVIATDSHGLVIYWNKTAEKEYGYLSEEALGLPISKFNPKFSVQKFIEEHPNPGDFLQGRDIYYDKAGRGKWVQKKISGMYGEDGSFQGVLIVATDISIEVELQDKLIESEEKFRKLFDVSSVPMAMIRADGVPLRVNDALVSLTGYSREELLNQTSPSPPPKGFGDVEAGYVTKIRKGEIDSYNIQKPYQTKSGKLIWVEITSNLIRKNDEPNFCIRIYKDITREINFRESILSLNEELQRNDEKVRTILENSLDAVVIHNEDESIRNVLGGYKRLTGYDSKELLGRLPSFMGVPENINWKEFAADFGAQKQFETEMQRKDGSRIWIQVHIKNLLQNPFVKGVVTTIRDVSQTKKYTEELKAAKDKAEELSELQSNFLANISHEIRTPLNGVIGTAELLKSELEDMGQLELVDIQIQSANRLLKTLNSILEISSGGESSRLEEPFDLVKACMETCTLHQQRAKQKGLYCNVENLTGMSSISALGNDEIFQQALGNLVDNSLKFTQEGHVKVIISIEGKQVLTRVEDTGMGISSTFLPNIFTPFSQESSGLGRKYEGNGLGLSIVKKYIQSMNGTITVESEKGVGTTFTIFLNLEQ